MDSPFAGGRASAMSPATASSAASISHSARADITPLIKGLEGDLCQAPHWGYVLEGKLTVTYGDGAEEVIRGGDLFHRPLGHTVRVGEDAEVILFSPQDEHNWIFGVSAAHHG